MNLRHPTALAIYILTLPIRFVRDLIRALRQVRDLQAAIDARDKAEIARRWGRPVSDRELRAVRTMRSTGVMR